ncbi:MAG: flagellar motor protein MotB, partial [Clostridia bacterium]|nr:flagellar motor protein MotB [Clostridia bacterium]
MAKPKPKIEKDTAERWLLTYADLMNLLLIFFIILYAMSQVEQDKFQQLAQSLREAFGDKNTGGVISQGGAGVSLINLDSIAPSNVIPAKLEEQQLDELKKKVDEVVEKKGLKGEIDVDVQERGVIISISAQLMFNSGSADLMPHSKPTIQEIGELLKEVPGKQIKVEGHTDTDPIKTSLFPSNWELSSGRATNVLRLLIDQVKIDPTRISSVGYGEFRPKVPNTSETNKATNRRVDIVILRDAYDKAEAGQAPVITKPAAASSSTEGAKDTTKTHTQQPLKKSGTSTGTTSKSTTVNKHSETVTNNHTTCLLYTSDAADE